MIKYYNTEVVFEEIPGEVTLAVNITNCQHNWPGCHSSYLRENIGNELNFKGEGNDPKSLKDDILHIKEKYPSIKIGLYSGSNNVDDFYWDNLNYIKLGPYIEEFGPLYKETTNQRLYEIGADGIKDITYKFWKNGRRWFYTYWK